MKDWYFDVPVVVKSAPTNPCIAVHGPGPDNQTCDGCTHLRYRVGPDVNPDRHHWKCDLRKVTNGPATDHKVRWPACAKYEKRTEEYHGG